MKRDLLSITDLSSSEIFYLIELAREMKTREKYNPVLQGKSVALLFEKSSLRTRVSFEVAVGWLGGHSLYLGRDEVGLGVREPVSDVALVLSRYVDLIISRTYSHESLTELARYSTVPVINALSDNEHPCQIIADLLTIQEKKGRLGGLTIAYVGDGNNVAKSLLLGAASVGASFQSASPPGFGFQDSLLQIAHRIDPNTRIMCTNNITEAIKNADVVYTDVWVSMGQEDETLKRRKAFVGYQVTPDLLSMANPDAIFMHPMPAHYGEEVSEDMLSHSQSVVYDQAENRLHAQKAILAMMLGGN